ncbi:hypothetical protein BHE74_00045375 [Ensete ventricosum]|nr:hypothetical protein GW17_00003196 [Ensete ventricosum]RWW48536.1 hypothetical protein BHE74_00045375 [Ensete ventricosum]
MTGGNLYDHLHKQHISLELPHLLKFSIDICKGMGYLHQNNIIHRDLKTANLLLDANSVCNFFFSLISYVKVGDFGVARFQNQEGVMTAETGTYRWMAPEVINHQHYDHKADVFSFAIVLWELATSRVPYDNMTPLQAALGVRQVFLFSNTLDNCILLHTLKFWKKFQLLIPSNYSRKIEVT